MVTDQPYWPVRLAFPDVDLDRGGLLTTEMAEYLAPYGWRPDRAYLPREPVHERPPPFAPLHIVHLTLGPEQPDGHIPAHYAVMLDDGSVLDPLFPDPFPPGEYRFEKSVSVTQVVGYTPTQETPPMPPRPILADHHLVEMAEDFARDVHAGQKDKAGAPYIHHVIRVTHRLRHQTPEVLAVAWLHDTVEDDENVDLDTLREWGFPERVVRAVDAITHRKDEPLDQYMARVRADVMARIVKGADINDNSDEYRLILLGPLTQERLRVKYARMRTLLDCRDD